MSKRDQRNVPREYSDHNLLMTDSRVQDLVNWSEKLSQKTRELPKVDNNGKSECPYAERLYAEKNEILERVIEKRNTVLHDRHIVDQIIIKHQRRLDVIITDANKIHTCKTKDGYSLAAVSQEYVLKKAKDQKRVINDALAWSGRIIETARIKKYPGKKPEKKEIPPSYPLPSTKGFGGQNINTGHKQQNIAPVDNRFNNELTNLFNARSMPIGNYK